MPRPTSMPDLDRITQDSAVMGGKPCVRGTRVTVGAVVGLLASGRTPDEILEAYPYLERADVDAAVAYVGPPLCVDRDGAGGLG